MLTYPITLERDDNSTILASFGPLGGYTYGRDRAEALHHAGGHEDLAAHDEAFACLQDLLDPSSFATTVVKAFREWGQGLLRLATAPTHGDVRVRHETHSWH